MDLATLQTALLALWDPTLVTVFLLALFLGMLIMWSLFVVPAQERVEALQDINIELQAHLLFEQESAKKAQDLANKSTRKLKQSRNKQLFDLWSEVSKKTLGAQETVPSDSQALGTVELTDPEWVIVSPEKSMLV